MPLCELAIGNPHPDIELGLPRKDTIRARLALPSAGLGPNCGVVFYIHGYGGACDDAYADKLLPWLAEQYNCIAVSVAYSGSELFRETRAQLSADFIPNAARIYGISEAALRQVSAEVMLSTLCQLLARRGIDSLDAACHLTRQHHGVYQSFGVLESLDHLQILHHLLLQYPELDHSRLYVIGTSFGGYIASMLRKLAPNTFRMIVDNSGFVATTESALPAMFGWSGISMHGVNIKVRNVDHWDDNPSSPHHLSPACKQLRDLTDTRQLPPSHTHWFGFISVQDKIIPVAHKRAQLAAFEHASLTPRATSLQIISAQNLDGRLFKTLDHGMAASMRGLFAHCYSQLPSTLPPVRTDFELHSNFEFQCGTSAYAISFDASSGVQMTVARH